MASFRKPYNVQIKTKELRNLNKNLESKVDERTRELTLVNEELKKSLQEIKILSGFLPICSSCKKIRDAQGYWNQLETYITEHSEAEFSHSICDDCMKKIYPELVDEKGNIKGF